jgi:hypothetical protein
MHSALLLVLGESTCTVYLSSCSGMAQLWYLQVKSSSSSSTSNTSSQLISQCSLPTADSRALALLQWIMSPALLPQHWM